MNAPIGRALTFFLLSWLFLPGLCLGEPAGEGGMAAEYRSVKEGRNTSFDAPLSVCSEEDGNRLSAEVYGIVEEPFADLAETLGSAKAWCEFVPLTLNVKSCTYRRDGEGDLLTFYAGRKFYQRPDQAYELSYDYRVEAVEDGYLRVALEAPDGPMGTGDYRIELEVMEVEDGAFVRILSGYRSSFCSRLATRGYLATLGREKVGFSSAGSDGESLVRGVRGVVERNAMRYYLALAAFMKTRHLPEAERFETRIRSWFAMSEKYSRQLHELEEGEYLDAKRRERVNQERLQEKIDGRSGLASIRPQGSPG